MNEKTATEELDDSIPSRTSAKKQALELQKLGEELIQLTAKQLQNLPLPENLLDAVIAARKMTRNRALYRQRQYIGKIMRNIDAEPIYAALETLRHPEREAVARFHHVETWRDRLVSDSDKAVTGFVEEFPDVDRQQLTQKVRAACKEQQSGKPAGAGRALFRFIDALVAAREQ